MKLFKITNNIVYNDILLHSRYFTFISVGKTETILWAKEFWFHGHGHHMFSPLCCFAFSFFCEFCPNWEQQEGQHRGMALGIKPICFYVCLKGKSSSTEKRWNMHNSQLLKQLKEALLLSSFIWTLSSQARLTARLLPQKNCNISLLKMPHFLNFKWEKSSRKSNLPLQTNSKENINWHSIKM